jgi:ribosomal protein L37E
MVIASNYGVTHTKGEAPMYCPQCGATNDDTADSCSACGFELSKYRQQWDAGDGAQQPAAAPAAVPAAALPSYGQQAGAPGYQAPPQGYGPGPYQNRYQPGAYQTPPYQQQPYQRNYQAPPYQSGYYGPNAYGAVPRVPNYLGWAIAVLILCFWPTGIPAVVFASQVDNRLAMGDIEGARESSRKAKMWCWITFGIAIGFWVIGIALAVIFAIVGAGMGGVIY